MNAHAALTLYTDGACLGNPGPGRWAFALVPSDVPFLETGQTAPEAAAFTRSGSAYPSTNNRMELCAVINALQEAHGRAAEAVVVVTDSQYVRKGITQWIHTWKHNGWKTAAKQPVKNKDLWEALSALADALSVEWRWVKGHAGDPYNELCDRLATDAARRAAQSTADCP